MAAVVQPVYAHITKQAEVCGGRAAIDDTRVRVVDVVWLHKEGLAPDAILERYPQLGLGQVHAALAYYYDHRDEIEAEQAEDDGWEQDHERRRAEDMARRGVQ